MCAADRPVVFVSHVGCFVLVCLSHHLVSLDRNAEDHTAQLSLLHIRSAILQKLQPLHLW